MPSLSQSIPGLHKRLQIRAQSSNQQWRMKHHTSKFETIAEWAEYGVPDPKLLGPKYKAVDPFLELQKEERASKKCIQMRTYGD
jgi:hypothetical protein